MSEKLQKERETEKWFQLIKERPWIFIIYGVLLSSALISIFEFWHQDRISSRDDTIDSLQRQIETKEREVSNLRHDKLREDIQATDININISQDESTNEVWDWSCSEKDVIIQEFATKIRDQDEALKICTDNLQSTKQELKEISDTIPGYEKGFTGEVIELREGETFQADHGDFVLSLINTRSSSTTNTYVADFRLQGESHRLDLGDILTFDYFGENYTLTLRSTGHSAEFFIHKSPNR